MPDFTGNVAEPTITNPPVTKSPEQVDPDNGVFFEHGGRKYSKDELAKKLDHADGFIEKLKAENQERDTLLEKAAAALEKQTSMAEVLEKLKTQPATIKEPDKVSEEKVEFDMNSFKADLKKDVLDTISAAEKAKQEDANWKNVTAKLTEKFKDKTNDVVAKAAAENGLSLDEAANLAKTKPALFLKLFPELNGGSPPKANIPEGRKPNLFDRGESVKPNSGYGQAKSTKDTVEIYLKRLAELSA